MPRSNKTFREWCKENNCSDLIKHLQDKRDADRYSYSSHTKVNWVCDLGHIHSIDFGKFTNPYRSNYKRFTCPICSGQKVLRGFNDLCTTNKSLANEWDFDKNTLNPTEVGRVLIKMFGGSVSTGIVGRQEYLLEIMEMVVHIVHQLKELHNQSR